MAKNKNQFKLSKRELNYVNKLLSNGVNPDDFPQLLKTELLK